MEEKKELSVKEEEQLMQEVLNETPSKELSIKNTQWKKCSEGLKTYRTKYKEMKEQMKEEEKKAKALIRIEYNRKIKDEMKLQKDPLSKKKLPPPPPPPLEEKEKEEEEDEEEEEEVLEKGEEEEKVPLEIPLLRREERGLSIEPLPPFKEEVQGKKNSFEMIEMFEMYEQYKKRKHTPPPPPTPSSPSSSSSSSSRSSSPPPPVISRLLSSHVIPTLKTDSRFQGGEGEETTQKFFFLKR